MYGGIGSSIVRSGLAHHGQWSHGSPWTNWLTDGQTRLKTFPSRNFVGGLIILEQKTIVDQISFMAHYVYLS